MPRYVAFLRGVSPMNARMPELKACFESIGFADVKTILASGNVVFTSTKKTEPALVKAIESGMAKHLSRSFPVIVRSTDQLLAILKVDPYSGSVSPNAKRVVTFDSRLIRGLLLPIDLMAFTSGPGRV